MPSIISWLAAPFILIFSVPLACFAICTTIFAFWVLYVRLLVLYFEMGYAILRSYLIASKDPQVSLPPLNTDLEPITFTRRRRRSSSSGRAIMAMQQKKSQSFAGLRGAVADKDFEGLGGWFLSSSDDDDDDNDHERLQALFSGIRTQPDSPIAGPRKREKPNFTLGGSQASSGIVSPEMVRTPVLVRTPGYRMVGSASGTASPESYFNVPTNGNLSALSTLDRYSRFGLETNSGSPEDKRKSRNNSIASLASVGIARSTKDC